VIEDAYRRAGRIISPDLATSYSDYLAAQNEDAEDFEDALIDAHTDVAALGLIDTVKVRLEQAAEALANEWLTEYQAEIALLTDKRREAYREISELSAAPFDVRLAKPSSRLQEGGKETVLQCFDRHLLCDDARLFPDELNRWEAKVQSVEMQRAGRIGWYRNPSRTSQDSLGIVYDYAGQTAIMRPDFLFFSADADGEIAVDIFDPHGDHLADSLPKLRGLADYVEKHGAEFHRIEAVAEVDGSLRVLDLKATEVREMVRRVLSAKEAYIDLLSAAYG
jgi:type III restriction enzyme